jgi:hypothetical protein
MLTRARAHTRTHTHTHQVFAQVFTYINAVMVNNIMLRKDLCHWTTGIQIRRNLATVEEWSQKRQLSTVLNNAFVEVTQVCVCVCVCAHPSNSENKNT